MSPDAALSWLKPGESAFDASLLDLIDERVQPGMVVWDIGANVGGFSLPAAARGATVIAVEADPFLVGLLARTAAANPGLHLRVERNAVGMEGADAIFALAGRGRCCNGLAEGALPNGHGRSRASFPVVTRSLDALLGVHPPPDLIKIDIEGGELLALAAAPRMLKDIAPILYVEVHRANFDPVAAILADAGYRASGAFNILAEPPARFV